MRMTQLERARIAAVSSSSPASPGESADVHGLAAVRRLVGAHFGDELGLDAMARVARMPTNTLTRHFHRAYGMSPMRWLWAFRTALAKEIIDAAPSWSLTEVSFHCGFGSSAHFSRRFRAAFGETPSAYRAEAKRRGGRTASSLESALLRASDPLLTRRAELVHRAFAQLERQVAAPSKGHPKT
jgi:transcriptional regulator GlxA family with amidase domain